MYIISTLPTICKLFFWRKFIYVLAVGDGSLYHILTPLTELFCTRCNGGSQKKNTCGVEKILPDHY